MTINLSFSARGKYAHCPRLYELHYVAGIREAGTTSSLLFGSAIDAACEDYMFNRNRDKARTLFRELWNEQEINGTPTELRTLTEIQYRADDLDLELLVQSDHKSLLEGTSFISVSDMVEVLSDPELITSDEEKQRLAAVKWFCMYRKGQIMLRSFMNWVDENVAEVLGAQIPIELEDDDGNKVTGKADFVIKVHGYDKPILVDLKTAARYYDRNSVKESEQLALYYFYLKQTKYPDMERAAYLVLLKQLKKNRKKTCKSCGAVTSSRHTKCAEEVNGKRCNGEFTVEIDPECTVQYIHDEIPQENIDATIDKFNVDVVKIKEQQFEQNLEGCEKYFGRRCPYWRYCHEGGCMDGLFKKEKK